MLSSRRAVKSILQCDNSPLQPELLRNLIAADMLAVDAMSRRRIMASTASMSAAMRLRRSSGCKGELSHCRIDLTARREDSIFSLTTPAKGMYNFVFFPERFGDQHVRGRQNRRQTVSCFRRREAEDREARRRRGQRTRVRRGSPRR